MIASTVTHPEVLASLARTGHGSTVLVTDGHWAVNRVGRQARTVFLNLTAGTPTVPEVASAVRDTVRIDRITQMRPGPEGLPSEVQDQTAELFPADVPRSLVSREEFYALAGSDDLVLAVVTGDLRKFGNVLLHVGVLPAAELS
ncbi:RbsD/FucU domain-containing protein [Amycolatopsis benzoatilytica]|uniref:RbsD/FucU domain-containing protein n=1 Tax=Amycolatopsis benzoatilytica TaxID=346045 RepID=UPI00036F3BD1|nr:RbsD/FucU domain-containing protein [Amycolatopsis benzoatilytica]